MVRLDGGVERSTEGGEVYWRQDRVGERVASAVDLGG